MAYNINADKNPTAINILKLQRYNFNYFSLEEVVFFEYLLVKARSFGFRQFYHSTATIASETGIKRTKLDSIIRSFKEKGILHIAVKGMPRVKHFTVDLTQILALLPKIYQLAANDKLQAAFNKLLVDFYKPLEESYQKKNNLKDTNKENQKEKKELLSDGVESFAFGESFLNFLLSLKQEFNLRDIQLKYDTIQLDTLYKAYDETQIFSALRKYFEEDSYSNKLSTFLKPSTINPKKNEYIEQLAIQEVKFSRSFLETLENTFNTRREMKSDKKQKFSPTALAINDNIVAKVTEVLKVHSEDMVRHAFIVYADDLLVGNYRAYGHNKPRKILPYFLASTGNSYGVIETYLDIYNTEYAVRP